MALPSPDRTSRRGSFLVLAMGIMIVLVLFSAQFFQYMRQQKRFSHRLGKHKLLSRTALGIAALALHKLQFGPMCSDNDGSTSYPTGSTPALKAVYDWLSRPLETMGDLGAVEIDLENDPAGVRLDAVLVPLKKPLIEGMQFDYQVQVSGRAADFEPCGLQTRHYPREKRGLIHLLVKTGYSRADTPRITEEFHFLGRVKVTAALAPVLSKFTLFIEQAGAAGAPFLVDYNAVPLQDNGNYSPLVLPQPLVLDNDGDDQRFTVQQTYREFIEAPRGLVYLGGESSLILNLGRSDRSNPGSNGGEEFQFFRSGLDIALPATFSFLPDGTQIIVSHMEKGVSSAATPRNNGFYDPIRKFSTLGKLAVDTLRMTHSSVFRLNGVDGNISPTLVLGDVKGAFLLLRFFNQLKPPAVFPKKLLECIDYPLFHARISSDYLPINRAFDVNDSFGFGYPKYLRYFSSFIASRSWNLGLGYIYKQTVPNPFHEFPNGDKLKSYLATSVPLDLLHEIPEPLRPIFDTDAAGATTAPTTLKSMKPFLDLLETGDRVVYEFPSEGDPDDWRAALKKRGLLTDGKLALNGWIRIKKKMNLDFDHPTSFITNGGIILDEGNINIRASLAPSTLVPMRKHLLLQLVAKKGNIILETPRGSLVQAHLIADGDGITTGKVVFAGRPKIIGAVAMKRLINQGADLNGFHGADLSYYPPLAALPDGPDAACEFPLLSCSFEPVPWLMP